MLQLRDTGAGPPVLLLHAFPCDASMWAAQAEALVRSGYRVLLPDLPGFGWSPLPQEPPDLDAVARQLLAALDAAGIGAVTVGGLSLGGYLAMALLRIAPERVAALLLVDTKAGADAEAARDNRLAVAGRVLAEGDTGFLIPAMLPGLLGPTTLRDRPDIVARVERWIRGADPRTIAWYQRAMAQRPDSLPDLQAFRRPALVAYGAEDTVLSPRSEQVLMAQALPDARLVEIPAVGHLSAVEDPDAVSDVLISFLAGLGD